MSLALHVLRVGGDTSGVKSARQAFARRDGVLLGLFDAGTLLGLGEASPLPGFGTDHVDHAARELVAIGPVSAVPESAATTRELCAGMSSPSARFALETALLDARARMQGQPLGSLLGTRQRVKRAVLVGHLDDAEIEERALRAVARGARELKFKARGADPSAEVARLVELRRRVATALHIRLDLNGGLDVSSARAALEAYARAEVAFVEEPTQGAALLELGQCAVPWFADESLLQSDLQTALIETSAASGVVLKPTLLGGLSACVSLAARAARAQKRVVVTHAFEGPVALAACAELALALGSANAEAPGLDPHAALSAFPAADVLQLPVAIASGSLQVEPATVLGHGVALPARLWSAE
jgi:L-alanine-DL-glutamate epimerase-like enolase superfamily enzyme